MGTTKLPRVEDVNEANSATLALVDALDRFRLDRMTSADTADLRCDRGLACAARAAPPHGPRRCVPGGQPWRKSTPLFVGLDVHKDSIAVAHAQGGRAEPPVFVGAIGTPAGRPRSADSPAAGEGVRADVRLRGRAVRVRPASLSDRARAWPCQVVAPSLIPKQAGRQGEDRSARCRRARAVAALGRSDAPSTCRRSRTKRSAICVARAMRRGSR